MEFSTGCLLVYCLWLVIKVDGLHLPTTNITSNEHYKKVSYSSVEDWVFLEQFYKFMNFISLHFTTCHTVMASLADYTLNESKFHLGM
jgi:hypothetical protein